jgi:hypothetical protein
VRGPSKSQINRCGELIRRVSHEGLQIDPEKINEAVRVIFDFRGAHSYPLAKVRLGLRSMIVTEGADEVIGQQLKRVPRIIRKLQRTVGSAEGRTALARLEDIGGVRAVVRNGSELDRVRLFADLELSRHFVSSGLGRPSRR